MYSESIKAEEVAAKIPEALEKLILLKLTNFNFWYVMEKIQMLQIKEQMDDQRLFGFVPFARRGDNEDIACFRADNNEEVVVFQSCDYTGYRPYKFYHTIWDWFRDAIELMITY